MPSPLRNRLKAIGAANSAPKPARPSGLLVYDRRNDMPDRLLSLPPKALRRIGWEGPPFDITKCLFLDTETTGLSGGAGTVAFLVGVGWIVPGDGETPTHMTVEQYLMRDYSDEPELLTRLAARMERFDCVCTFNGRHFDMPLLESRYTINRMRHLWRDMEDLDLLYPARRTWKLRLGSCRLGRLEEYILGAPRGEDLPGSEVPKRFFEYLKTGDITLLEDIVTHNRQDIATLGLLLDHLCGVHEAPEKQTERKDIFSVGRTLERRGELKDAKELYRISAIPAPAGTLEALTGEHVAGMANWRAYHIARRNGDTNEMRRLLETMRKRGQMPFEVLIELSKLAEHRDKDFRKAMEYASEAEKICPEQEKEKLEKRLTRLKDKGNL